MALLRQFWQDLRSGVNLDAYLAIVLAIVLGALNLLGIVPQQQLGALTLAVLSLLVVSTLVNRNKLDEVQGTLMRPSPIVDEFPNTYDEDLKGSGDLTLVGISLARTVRTYYDKIENRVRNGSRVRVLLVKPGSDGLRLAESRVAINQSFDRANRDVMDTYEDLIALQALGKGLKIRVINQELSFGVIHVNPGTAAGCMYIEYYPYRTRGYDHMKLVLRPSDGKWYDFHARQMDLLWDDAEIYRREPGVNAT
jgi:hypothetical protein